MRLFLLLVVFATMVFSQDLLLQNAQIVDPAAQKIHRGAILIRNGKIEQILNTVPKDFIGVAISAKTFRWE